MEPHAPYRGGISRRVRCRAAPERTPAGETVPQAGAARQGEKLVPTNGPVRFGRAELE